MIYQSPLAYLLGIEGYALLRGFAGDFGKEFTEDRIAEIRRLLADDRLTQGTQQRWVTTEEGYREWSKTYDVPGNGAFAFEEPYVKRFLEPLPPGVALDAACGTGRYSEILAALGHSVVGVDSSPEMLALARKRVPGGDFRPGTLHELPVRDGEADVVVCALALTHVPDLAPVMAEFARALRPGGHLIVSDLHEGSVLRGSIPAAAGPDGEPARIATYRHLTGDYLRAALPAGLQVRACEEPRIGGEPSAETPDLSAGEWNEWPWNLSGFAPMAAWAANEGRPATVIWHFQKSPGAR